MDLPKLVNILIQKYNYNITYGREAIVAKFEYSFFPSLEFINMYGDDNLFCLQN